jgi:hypothetical protein
MMTQLQKLLSFVGLYSTMPLANRNYFVDGRHDLIGISGSPALVNTYGASTMWKVGQGTGGVGTSTVATSLASLSPTWFDSSPKNALGFTLTTASTGTVAGRTAPAIYHSVEGGHTAAGKSLTLSFKMWVNSGSIVIPSIIAVQNFGTGGSPTAPNIFDKSVNWTVTTTPTRFSVRLDVPALQANPVFGTNNNDYLNLGLWLPPGVTFTLWMTEAQCELCSPQSSSDLNGQGGAPTVYEFRGYQAEVARVQRYLTNPGGAAQSVAVTSTTYLGTSVYFPVQMRSTPAMSYADSALTPNTISTAANGNGRTLAAGSVLGGPNARGFYVDAVTTDAAPGTWARFFWTADARL